MFKFNGVSFDVTYVQNNDVLLSDRVKMDCTLGLFIAHYWKWETIKLSLLTKCTTLCCKTTQTLLLLGTECVALFSLGWTKWNTIYSYSSLFKQSLKKTKQKQNKTPKTNASRPGVVVLWARVYFAFVVGSVPAPPSGTSVTLPWRQEDFHFTTRGGLE